MPKSYYLDNTFLAIALIQGPVIYVAIFTTSPGPSGGGVEVSGGGYGRQTVTFGTPSNGQTVSTEAVIFPIATGSWGTITSFGLYDASSGGNLLYYGNLSTPRTILASDQIQFPAGQLICTET